MYTSWSVSVEWWLYLIVFPIICMILQKSRRALLPVASIILTFQLVTLHVFTDAESWTVGWTAWLRGTGGFMTGAALWSLQARGGRIRNQPGLFTDLSFLLFILLNAVLSFLFKQPPWWLICFIPVIINGLCTSRGWSSRFLKTPLMVWLGNISFSLYLLHPLILLLMKQAYAKGIIVDIRLYVLVSVAGTFLLAGTVYKLFEVPARNILRRRLSAIR
ncbi:MAG: acyltransferase family protein [Luteolibacter sp.]